MQGWCVTIRHEEDGFYVEERKSIFVLQKQDKELAPMYYDKYDEEFSTVEKRIRRLMLKKNYMQVYIENIDDAYSKDNMVAKVFVYGDEVKIVANDIEREVSIDEGKKFLQKTLVRLKKQAKDACWLIAIA